MIRFRATRATPPGLITTEPGRRAMFSAALQQSQALFEAARAVGPLARPIPLFYALSQAGRAIAAAWLTQDWQIGEHGLTEDRTDQTWKSSGILNFKIQPQKRPG